MKTKSFAGYEFQDPSLYELARTHTSYANEAHTKHNERLEFLGDSVLSLVISQYLFENYPQLPEGSLSRIRAEVVCERSLFQIARQLHLGDELLLGKGESQSGGRDRPSVVSDAFEAMLAAVFLDSGLESVKRVLLPLMEEKIKATAGRQDQRDYKTALQEHVQKTPGNHISYRLVKESGPDHDRTYTVSVYVNGVSVGKGQGRSKKQAEQMAAKTALCNLNPEDRHETL